MAGFTGIFNTGQLATGIVKPDFASMIIRYMPNGQAPLFGLTSMLSTETATQTEHGFFTKTMLFPAFTLGVAVADGTTDIFSVTSSANLLPNMIMQSSQTRENVMVVQILSPTQIKVIRGVGTVAGASNLISTEWVQVGTAFEEGSARPNALNIKPVKVTNLTQIFRNTWALTDTARATAVLAGDTNVAESKMDAAAFHAADIEKALFFGQKSQGSYNGQPFRTMDGIISLVSNIANYPSSYLTPNVTTASSTTNYTQLEAMLDPVFNQATDPANGNERVMFVGGQARRVINKIGRLSGNYQIMDGATSFGLQFSTFKIARGTFRLIEHPLFNSNVEWSKLAVALDPSTFNIAYLGDRKTKEAPFGVGQGGDAGLDAQGGTLTTELTTLLKNPPANAIIYGLTDGASG